MDTSASVSLVVDAHHRPSLKTARGNEAKVVNHRNYRFVWRPASAVPVIAVLPDSPGTWEYALFARELSVMAVNWFLFFLSGNAYSAVAPPIRHLHVSDDRHGRLSMITHLYFFPQILDFVRYTTIITVEIIIWFSWSSIFS